MSIHERLYATSLAKGITVGDYKNMVARMDKNGIASFIKQRLTERYIDPVLQSNKQHGFSIMAQACLLIETYESFRQGWQDTEGKKKKPFELFFTREGRFAAFAEYHGDFYFNVRCGLLHQGETKNGWKINRKPNELLFNKTDKTIQAVKFMEALQDTIEDYVAELIAADWSDSIWENTLHKIELISINSIPTQLYFAYGSNMDEKQLHARNVIFGNRRRATLKGYKLVFNKIASQGAGIGFANIVPAEGCEVEGILMDVGNMEAIDGPEGYPTHYNKQKLKVECDGKERIAIIYVAQPDMQSNNLHPTQEYLNRLLAGKDFLSESYLNQLAGTPVIR